jgi:hypothetical protein
VYAFARGARTGVTSTLIASAAKTASSAVVNFVARSRITTGTGRRRRQGQWADCGLLRDPLTYWGAVALRRPGGMLKSWPPPDQMAKASSSNATATRRLAGSSTASS